MLTPTRYRQPLGQVGTLLQDLAQPVADQCAFGGVMNVGVHDERIGPCRLRSGRFHPMPFGHDEMTDPFDRFGTQQTDVVANASPAEARCVVPVSHSHDVPQRAVLFGEVLEAVVIEIATEPHRRKHENLPVIEPRAATVVARLFVDISGDERQDVIAQCGLRIDVLQRREHWDDFIPAVKVQFDMPDRRTVQSPLIAERLSHPCHSSKMAT